MSDNAPQGLKPETVLLHGPVAEEISRRVHGVVDLLVVGSRGYGPLRRALLGSVSGALVRDAGYPVIVIPRTAVGPGGRQRLPRRRAHDSIGRGGGRCSPRLDLLDPAR